VGQCSPEHPDGYAWRVRQRYHLTPLGWVAVVLGGIASAVAGAMSNVWLWLVAACFVLIAWGLAFIGRRRI
jgi:hypothetical protein